MPCDDLSAMHAAASAHPGAGTGDGAKPAAARRQPGSALRQLEALAQDELRQMLGRRAPATQDGGIADPVWAGLAWDMGLNGTAIAAAGTAPPLPGYLALGDHD